MSRDLTGKTFGRLTVISFSRHDPRIGRYWNCRCVCGVGVEKTTSKLQDKHNPNVSCGCARRDSIKKAAEAGWKATTKFSHPLKLKLKWLYRNMIKRCHDPRDHRFLDYGGRGISVCSEWRNDRYSFYDWCLANGFKEGVQIDRRNNEGPYSPDNCKFSTQIEQANNTRKNVFLTWQGRTMTIAQWSRELNVRYEAIRHRISRGWSVDRIFTQPFRY